MRMIIFVVIVVAGLVVMIGRPNITINFNYGEKQRNKGPQRATQGATGGHKDRFRGPHTKIRIFIAIVTYILSRFSLGFATWFTKNLWKLLVISSLLIKHHLRPQAKARKRAI